MAQLLFLKNGRQAIRFPLPQGITTIGRQADCAITLEGTQVSRIHAEISYEGGYYHLQDRSKNGTSVNEKNVKKARLGHKDIIRIGDWRLQFLENLSSEKQETVTVTSLDRQRVTRGDTGLANMVGQSEPMKRLFDLIRKVATNDTPALILGETGTGKELVANALHQLSKRSPYPFWAMNCASISPQLVESELFGHERGAFTGATDLRRGAFEQAGRGTLFLDEVGELSLDIQSKLLRVLETQKIRRVGGGEEISVKCRIVAATHRHLIEEVQKKRFREDLYYRLFVMPLEVPPLRNRNGDILSIAERFLQEMSPERPLLLTEETRQKLLSHRWPGNVRELKNVMLRSVMLSEGETIGPHHLVFLPHSMESGESPQEIPARTMEEMEREMILQKLKETEWNKAKAARKLGIATSTIFKKIREYGLKE